MQNKKLPITAVVAGLNDAKWIRDFLDNISFCDEIIFVDLQSDDNTLEIARQAGATVFSHERVPVVEVIQYTYLSKAKHDWLLMIDPDERISDELIANIYQMFESDIPQNIAGIYGTIIYYMKKHQLKGTMWGGPIPRKMLVHKDRYTFRPIVHRGHTLKDGFAEYQIPFDGKNYIHHYWMTSYKQLFSKHWRYIKKEPQSKYESGERSSIKKIIKNPLKAFKTCLWQRKGYKDGFTGLFLSLFWMWYNACNEIGLYIYQRKHN